MAQRYCTECCSESFYFADSPVAEVALFKCSNPDCGAEDGGLIGDVKRSSTFDITHPWRCKNCGALNNQNFETGSIPCRRCGQYPSQNQADVSQSHWQAQNGGVDSGHNRSGQGSVRPSPRPQPRPPQPDNAFDRGPGWTGIIWLDKFIGLLLIYLLGTGFVGYLAFSWTFDATYEEGLSVLVTLLTIVMFYLPLIAPMFARQIEGETQPRPIEVRARRFWVIMLAVVLVLFLLARWLA